MQTAYIADLPISAGSASSWTDLVKTVEGWIRDRLRIELSDSVADGVSPDGHAVARRRKLGDATVNGPRLTRWDTRQIVPSDPTWRYEVTVWLSEDVAPQAGRAVRCRLGVSSTTGQIVQPSVPLGRPRLVGEILQRHHVIVDDLQLGHGHLMGTDDIPSLLALLESPARLLPVLVMTPTAVTGRPRFDPDRLASRLGGLAHVIVLSARTTTFALTDALGGSPLSVFGGAVRMYWPGFQTTDPREAHPIWFDTRLGRTTPDDFANELFEQIGRVSAIALGAPAIESQLLNDDARRRQAATTARLHELSAELAARTAKNQETAPAATSPNVMENEAWIRDYEDALNTAEEASNERDALQTRLEEVEDELAAVRRALRDVNTASAAIRDDRMTASTINESTPPRTVLEAVEAAEAVCQNLVFLPEAFESADNSQYSEPTRVLADLRALDSLAGDWRSGRLSQGFKAAFAEQGIPGYRDGIGQIAETKYEEDYRRRYLDQTVMLGPHLRHGTGPVTTILRIYWYVDNANKTLVIGHVGKKLRDDGNG